MPSRPFLARVDWGHVLLVLVLAAVTAFYLADSWEASARVRNLILVLPASILSFVLCAAVLARIFTGVEAAGVTSRPDVAGSAEPFVSRMKTPLTMALFAAYIASLPWLGFDVGTALFMTAMLLLDGVRNPILLVGLPLVFALAVTICFKWLLPYPMPLLLL